MHDLIYDLPSWYLAEADPNNCDNPNRDNPNLLL